MDNEFDQLQRRAVALLNGKIAQLQVRNGVATETANQALVVGEGAAADVATLDVEKLDAAVYTAADVLAKLLTVDGAGSGLDADLLDGNNSAFFLPAASYTAADILTKLLTVDGAGSGLDADLLDGQSSAAFQPADVDLTAVANSGLAAAAAAWAAAPILTSSVGAITSYTSSGQVYFVGKMMWVEITATITNAGTGLGTLNITNMPGSSPRRQPLLGVEDAVANKLALGRTTGGGTNLGILADGGGTLIATNARFQMAGWLEIS